MGKVYSWEKIIEYEKRSKAISRRIVIAILIIMAGGFGGWVESTCHRPKTLSPEEQKISDSLFIRNLKNHRYHER